MNTAYEKKKKNLCNHGVPFAQKLRKNVRTYADFAQRWATDKKNCYWRYKDEHDEFIFCIFFALSIASRNHPQTLGIIIPQP